MDGAKPRLRLALDLGSNSIGWTLFALDKDDWPSSVIKSGVRIFSNSRIAKNHLPLSVDRRVARGARNRRDRMLQRKRSLLFKLNSLKLLPVTDEAHVNFAKMDPYQLRHEGLSRRLTEFELGRVLLHLSQRRGFLSNRKDKAKDEGGKSLGGKILELRSAINESGTSTLGSFLYKTCRAGSKRLPVRMRSNINWYPNRALYEEEYSAIRNYQQKYHSEISDADWGRIEHLLFFQRPLKKQQPGKCLFKPELDRAYRALPSYQRFRILQQVANLKIQNIGQAAVPLTLQQRQVILERLFSKKEETFDAARKLLKIEGTTFNLESGSNSFKAAKGLFGDKTSCLLSNKKYFGKIWSELTKEDKDFVTEKIIDEIDETELRRYLFSRFELSEDQIENIVSLSETDFERGYGEFCKEILQELSHVLQEKPEFKYADAAKQLGYHHSDFRPDSLLNRLPHYAEVLKSSVRPVPNSRVREEREFGRIANPTVHVALNQLRKIINALLERFGAFDQIVVEVARDLPLGEDGLGELAREIKKNESQNDAWRKILEEHGQRDSFGNRLRLRLWSELDGGPLARQCPYSGENIGIAKLFSADIEVDHILPKSQTFSNHHSNLTVCVRRANQFKGERAPYQAFTASNSPYKWEEILERVKNMPLAKQRKFSPDAMERYQEQDLFLERQLNDTRFISKATCQYLQSICKRVMVSRGSLTAFVRSEVNLNRLLSETNKKNRNDHRHHAVDSFIIGLTPVKTIRQVERLFTSRKSQDAHDKLSELVHGFKTHLDRMIVSHRADHSPAAKFFEETNYGRLENGTLTVRKSVDTLKSPEEIISPAISKFVAGHPELTGEELGRAITERYGAKKVRILKKDSSAICISHPKDNPRFKKWVIPVEINKIEFWQLPQDRGTSRLIAKPYTSFEAYQYPPIDKQPHPAARKVLTIRKGDFLRIEDRPGIVRTVVVESLRPVSEIILFSDHNIGKNEDAKGRSVSFGGLAAKKVRVIHCNELGEIRDAGPWWIDDSKNSRNSTSGLLS